MWSGQYEAMERVREKMQVVLPVTLFLIFALLYANTKSLPKTFIVLLAVPFSAVGAIWLLYALGYHISIGVWVGLIALLGLDAETGVFMLLYLDLSYDEAKAPGRMRNREDLKEAIMHGAVKRVRPKVMTVACAFFGLVPIMWSTGAGADVMKRIAAPMIGGLFTSFLWSCSSTRRCISSGNGTRRSGRSPLQRRASFRRPRSPRLENMRSRAFAPDEPNDAFTSAGRRSGSLTSFAEGSEMVTNGLRAGLVLFLFSFPVLASGPVNMVSTDVVVPSAGRGPGAADSFWVTDLWVRCNDRTDVTLEFHALDAPSGAPTATATLSMTQPVVYLADVMKNTFGLDSGFGNIRVHSARPVAATLRVYTTGGGGSYGFASMGMPGSMSMGSPRMMGSDDSRRHYMQGLLPQPQARVNVMVANTSATTIQGTCDVLDADGGAPASGPASFRFSIPAYSGHQFGNVLAGVHSRFGDDAGLQLRISLDAGNGGTMMTLASVVDNETNDSYVVMGSMMDDEAGMMMGN